MIIRIFALLLGASVSASATSQVPTDHIKQRCWLSRTPSACHSYRHRRRKCTLFEFYAKMIRNSKMARWLCPPLPRLTWLTKKKNVRSLRHCIAVSSVVVAVITPGTDQLQCDVCWPLLPTSSSLPAFSRVRGDSGILHISFIAQFATLMHRYASDVSMQLIGNIVVTHTHTHTASRTAAESFFCCWSHIILAYNLHTRCVLVFASPRYLFTFNGNSRKNKRKNSLHSKINLFLIYSRFLWHGKWSHKNSCEWRAKKETFIVYWNGRMIAIPSIIMERRFWRIRYSSFDCYFSSSIDLDASAI